MVNGPAGPRLAATYEGGDPALLARLVPLVDYLEVAPDTISRMGEAGPVLDPETMAELSDCGLPVIVHGVGLSIASADGMSEDYLRLLDGVFEALPVAWHSEHLGYTMVGGEQLGTMLPAPRTNEALDLVCGRVRALRARYPVPFLLEHVARILPDPPADHPEAAFFNALARDSGCGFIVDAYNLECDRENFGFDVDRFLDELDLAPVCELHVAGGGRHKGMRMDVHARRADAATQERTGVILARASNLRAVTFEFLRQAVPSLGHDAICAELADLREMLSDAESG